MGRGWRIGRVDTFRPKGHGFDSLSTPRWHLGQVLHSQLPVVLRREIPASVLAVSGATLSSIVDLKRRYRNSLNESIHSVALFSF